MTQAPPRPYADAEADLAPRTPRARCHSCGSYEVRAVCCRCQQLLCSEHDDVANPVDVRRSLQGLRRRPEPLARVESDARPNAPAPVPAAPPPVKPERPERPAEPERTEQSAEPERTEQSAKPERTERLSGRHFCRDCMPAIRPYDAELMAASITLALGVITGFWSLVLGGLLIVIGGFRVGWRVLTARRQRRMDDQPPDLHLDPRVRKLTMVETLSGTAHLDADHDYRTEITGVRGRIRVETAWGRADWVQVMDHRRRNRIQDGDDLSFSSGSLVVRGPADLVLHGGDFGQIKNLTTVVLRPRTSEHLVLRTPGGHGDGRWPIEID